MIERQKAHRSISGFHRRRAIPRVFGSSRSASRLLRARRGHVLSLVAGSYVVLKNTTNKLTEHSHIIKNQ